MWVQMLAMSVKKEGKCFIKENMTNKNDDMVEKRGVV